jgi:hypothetical protein
VIGPFRPFTSRLAALSGAFLLAASPSSSETSFDLEAFLDAQPERFGTVLASPSRYRVQILYTRIDRDARNRPTFTTFSFRLGQEYFYPASTVKLPVALLALEALARLDRPGLDRDTAMFTDAAHPSQSAVTSDPTAPRGLPTVGHYVRRIFAVSDNDAYNRLYEFLGQDEINASIRRKGYAGVRIVHRLSLPLSEADNRRANPVRFVRDGDTVYARPAREARGRWLGSTPTPLGIAEIRDGERVERPKDFARRNALPLQALHDMILAVMFPDSVPARMRFALPREDLDFVRRAMALTPRETGIEAYADAGEYPDGYVKFLLYGGDQLRIPAHIRSFNKVGEAYGFLTDAAYVVDFEEGIEFLLAATVYTNANGTFNDDEYEYEEIGFPFLKSLGESIYQLERERTREHRPDLSALRRLLESEARRNP